MCDAGSSQTNVRVDFVIKLGGSAITKKGELETFQPDNFLSAVSLIKQCLAKGLRFIVVHGAGSFGHHQAKEYSVNDGFRNERDADTRRSGFCRTRLSVLKLHHLITSELVNNGVNAVGISPCNSWTTSAGHVVQEGVEIVTSLLIKGFVPILHGDCVIDDEKGCHVLSGDTIIKVLCERTRPSRVIFLMNVEGVFNTDPTESDAQLINDIMVSTDGSIGHEIDSCKTSGHDVTGGIRLKLSSAIDIIKTNRTIRVFMCKIGTLASINACLYGDFRGEKGTALKS